MKGYKGERRRFIKIMQNSHQQNERCHNKTYSTDRKSVV